MLMRQIFRFSARSIQSGLMAAVLVMGAFLFPGTAAALIRSADMIGMCIDIAPNTTHMITNDCNNQGNQRMWLDWLSDEQKARWRVPKTSSAAILRVGDTGQCMAGLNIAGGPKCDKNYGPSSDGDLVFLWDAPSVGGHRRMIMNMAPDSRGPNCLIMHYRSESGVFSSFDTPKGRGALLERCVGLEKNESERKHFRQFWWVEQ